jgi:predicted permease
MRNVSFALRMLLKTPFVTSVAVASLALGIGANTAIFSMFDQILLHSLPVRAPGELVNLSMPGPIQGNDSCNQAGDCTVIFTYPMFRDLERQQTVLSGIAGHRTFGASLAIGDEPMIAQGVWITGNYFSTLGLQPSLGRLLVPSDNEPGADNQVAVIGHRLWMDRFGGRPSAVGERLRVNSESFTIVGVAPEGFRGTTFGSNPDFYIPMQSRRWLGTYDGLTDRRSYWVYVFGRLKPGISIAEAKASLDGVIRPILSEVDAPLQIGMSDQTMARFKAKEMVVESGRRGQSQIFGEARIPVLMLLSITAVVLLIACANIANLLLARGAGRATEMGVRLALGATRGHLLKQLLTESVVLAIVGGAVSLFVAWGTLKGMAALLPADAGETFQFSIRPSMIAFSGILALVTGLLFGLFPALHSTRADLITTIRAGAGQLTGGRAAARFRNVLVTLQIALSTALLVSAGLFTKSLANVSRVDLGVSVDNVVTFAISPLRVGYDTLNVKVLYGRIEEELRAIPGVRAVSSALVPLLGGNSWGNNVRVQGFECLPDTDCNSRFNAIGAGYFASMGSALLSGREFTESDAAGGPRVAVVNRAFAEKFNLGTDAVGKFMSRGGDSLNIQIVGLLPNIKYNDVKREPQPVFYLPWAQERFVSQLYFYLRTSLPPAQLVGTIPGVLKRIDATLPVEELRTMPEQIRENIFMDRLISILSAAFAVLATLLAAVGLYGVLAYSVSQRTREIGVRMALGADGARVRGMVLRQVGLMILIGSSLGIAGAIGLGRAASSLLYGLEGSDPLVFALAVALLALIALGAGFMPALRASRTNPMQALRYD